MSKINFYINGTPGLKDGELIDVTQPIPLTVIDPMCSTISYNDDFRQGDFYIPKPKVICVRCEDGLAVRNGTIKFTTAVSSLSSHILGATNWCCLGPFKTALYYTVETLENALKDIPKFYEIANTSGSISLSTYPISDVNAAFIMAASTFNNEYLNGAENAVTFLTASFVAEEA